MDSKQVFDVTDHSGATSRHLAVDKESAIQAHLIHYGLMYLQEDPNVSNGVLLSDFKESRESICWDKNCCIVAASEVGK